jgi:hypothetical protein
MQQGHGALCEFLHRHSDVMDEKTGNTALHIVAETDEQYIARQLAIKCPEKLHIQNMMGDLPLHVVCRAAPHHNVLQEFIEQYSAGLQIRNNTGELPLHIACQSRRVDECSIIHMVAEYPDALSVKMPGGRWLFHCLLRHHPYFGRAIGVFLQRPHQIGLGEVDEDGFLPFMLAARGSSLSTLYGIVRKRPDLLLEVKPDCTRTVAD